jgi:hypothetical protein
VLPEEEVLGRQLRAGQDHQPQHAQQVSEEGECRSSQIELVGRRAAEFVFAEYKCAT